MFLIRGANKEHKLVSTQCYARQGLTTSWSVTFFREFDLIQHLLLLKLVLECLENKNVKYYVK